MIRFTSQKTGCSPLSLASRSVHHWFFAVLGTTNWILALVLLFRMLTTSTIRTWATRNITNSRVTPMCASSVFPVPSWSSFTLIATLIHRRRASLAWSTAMRKRLNVLRWLERGTSCLGVVFPCFFYAQSEREEVFAVGRLNYLNIQDVSDRGLNACSKFVIKPSIAWRVMKVFHYCV
jgi:hypothetical protein